ncbi:MAG: DNA-binding protein WhiA [Alkaliphilus sp.]|nr:DNA-binding protein WhiA [Alkaliphilus sp. AH-315-G20]PHS31346.1 MAG: DNA-binding protein WhiA [Alkaliphilus sp.]
MSFSSRTKGELARINLNEKCCQLAELAALVRMCGSLHLQGHRKLSFDLTTENAAVARKAFRIIKRLFSLQAEVIVRRNTRLKKNNHYLVSINHLSGSEDILGEIGILKRDGNFLDIDISIPKEIVTKNCCKRAYLRGAFLGAASISDPEKTYHLEFVTNSIKHSKGLESLLNTFDLKAKTIKRKESYVVYLKEGDKIIDLLNIIGAHKALLDIENIRILKSMRNSVNRVVNCETANLTKVVNAAIRQVQKIEFIKQTVGLHKLPDNLREVAETRLNNREASLKELGKMLSIPIGKSGINHRLRKIEEFADKLKS